MLVPVRRAQCKFTFEYQKVISFSEALQAAKKKQLVAMFDAQTLGFLSDDDEEARKVDTLHCMFAKRCTDEAAIVFHNTYGCKSQDIAIKDPCWKSAYKVWVVPTEWDDCLPERAEHDACHNGAARQKVKPSSTSLTASCPEYESRSSGPQAAFRKASMLELTEA
eukprot:3213958-Amphidinium_carterae.1